MSSLEYYDLLENIRCYEISMGQPTNINSKSS